MADLTGPHMPAKSGTTKHLVVLLHGYGADGNDLIGLAPHLANVLPDAAFVSPNAPERSLANPMGYQWFPIPWLDGSPESAMEQSFHRSVDILNEYLTKTMAAEGVTPAQTALIGFSQGTMMSLHVAPRRPDPVACVVGFSGRLLEGERLKTEAVSKPPVLLVHGDQDEMIPVAALQEAQLGLSEAGIPVRWHISKGIGHGIGPDGLEMAAAFLSDHLG
jgi:phospholipase/carboxylesterase